MSSDAILCTRCRTVEAPPMPGHSLPEGWEGVTASDGTVKEAVCPGCQLAILHPRCTSLRSDAGYGGRVDLQALLRGEPITYTDQDDNVLAIPTLDELPRDELAECGYIDFTVAWTADDPFPDWTCPKCGGSDFEGVHDHRPEPDSSIEGISTSE